MRHQRQRGKEQQTRVDISVPPATLLLFQQWIHHYLMNISSGILKWVRDIASIGKVVIVRKEGKACVLEKKKVRNRERERERKRNK